MGRTERRAAEKKNGQLRSRPIPPAALTTGKALMDAHGQATKRYNEWAADTVAAMNIGDPREGHRWLVDPTSGTVREERSQ